MKPLTNQPTKQPSKEAKGDVVAGWKSETSHPVAGRRQGSGSDWSEPRATVINPVTVIDAYLECGAGAALITLPCTHSQSNVVALPKLRHVWSVTRVYSNNAAPKQDDTDNREIVYY